MSMLPGNPGSAGFNDFPPGPHSGTRTDPDDQFVSDRLDRRLWRIVRSRWTWLVLGCVVVGIGILLSIF